MAALQQLLKGKKVFSGVPTEQAKEWESNTKSAAK